MKRHPTLGSTVAGLNELHAMIHDDPALRALLEQVQSRLAQEAHPDPGHDLSHFFRVALWTIRLGEGEIDSRLAIASALLHDIINLPKNSPDRHRASELSADVAHQILPPLGFSPEQVTWVADAVRDHSYSRGKIPETLLGKALQDADRLEALGSLGIMRLLSTGARMGSDYFHADAPWGEGRELDDKRYSVDHFFVKLFKLPATMNTAAGRREAEKRAQVMHDFLRQLGNEIGAPYASA
jgi:uncharacterized protein